jgi:subtilase family serine protease
MQIQQKNQWRLLSIVASFALILAIVSEALLPRGSIARASLSRPAFKAHTIQAMPIFHTLSTLQNVLPAHSRSDPKTTLYKCQREIDPQPVHCYGPYQIRQAYGVSDLLAQHFTGQGSTIAIIDAYGSPTIQKDLQAFDNAWGLPEAKLHIIAPYGQPKADSEWVPETSLDVEWAHAIAPDATLNLIVAKSSNDVDLYKVTKYAVEHNLGDVLSLSFGENEKCADPALRSAEHTLFSQATSKGITILAAAGDSGSAQLTCDGTSFEEAISFPAADPLVTAIGGTDLNADAVSGQYISQSAWNESSIFNKATGGGYSAFYPQPVYQRGVTNSTSGRAIPDISLNASVNGGVIAFDSDLSTGRITISIMGGTSVATPELAGIIADGVQMVHHRLGLINPALYKLGTSKDYAHLMYDITSGNNVLASSSIAGYPAVKGWDPVTGWGTPQGALPFLQALIADQTTGIQLTSTKHPGPRP